MNDTDQNTTPQEPSGRSAIERQYDAIVALAIAHPDTVQVVSTATAAGHLPDVSNPQD